MKRNSKGFTVVELMIATAVFGVILLVVTIAILQFTRVYYKGVTQANTQDISRTIVDRISQAIQFNGGNIVPTNVVPSFCIGNQQYTYVLGKQVVDAASSGTKTSHALVVRDLGGCIASSPMPPMNTTSTTGRELLAPKMRLSRMEVTSLGSSLYKIRVKVVFGDDELLTNPSTVDAKCKNQQGSQFCAVSDITTVVTKRVQ